MAIPNAASDTSASDAAEALVDQLFLTTEGRTNPYPIYHRLRELRPVHRAKLGMWLLIADKRARSDADLLSALVRAESDSDRLSDDELVTLASLLFAAGFETTTNLFGNGLLALLRHPDQLALLRATPPLSANLPDELLRYDGTAQMANRVTETSIDVGGTTIPAGEQVFMLLGAGNHDSARVPNPDQLDVTRTAIEPLTFGGGVHFCLGAALARAEIEITFGHLLGRFAIRTSSDRVQPMIACNRERARR